MNSADKIQAVIENLQFVKKMVEKDRESEMYFSVKNELKVQSKTLDYIGENHEVK